MKQITHYPEDGGVLQAIELAIGQKTKKAICGKSVKYTTVALTNISCLTCRQEITGNYTQLEHLRGHIDDEIINRAQAEYTRALGFK